MTGPTSNQPGAQHLVSGQQPVSQLGKGRHPVLEAGATDEELQKLKARAQALAADGANWSMDVGCMFVLAMIERIEAGAGAPP